MLTHSLLHRGSQYFMLFALVVVPIVLIGAPQTSSLARAQEERVLENTISKNVPIKVKIKKEKEESFKDLKNEKWVRELEVEVTNTGDRPIYYLDMFLRTNVDA